MKIYLIMFWAAAAIGTLNARAIPSSEPSAVQELLHARTAKQSILPSTIVAAEGSTFPIHLPILTEGEAWRPRNTGTEKYIQLLNNVTKLDGKPDIPDQRTQIFTHKVIAAVPPKTRLFFEKVNPKGKKLAVQEFIIVNAGDLTA